MSNNTQVVINKPFKNKKYMSYNKDFFCLQVRPTKFLYPYNSFHLPMLMPRLRLYSSDGKTRILQFANAERDRLDILKAVKGKSGIYLWSNNLNGKKYVGSSVNLHRRVLEYFNTTRLLGSSSMPINLALLKYKHCNFTFEVLEFCDIDKVMSREKDYFDLLSPEYNILKIPGSPSRGSG